MGRAAVYGDPPARLTISGRAATEKRARISDAVMARVPRAYLVRKGSVADMLASIPGGRNDQG
jgi:hypothetical protein